MATDYDDDFDAAGAAYNIDPNILRGIATTESGNNPSAVSPKGALGLMQIMPGTAEGLGVDPTIPKQAIWGAANLLDQNRKQFGGSITQALQAYNGGTDPSRWNNPETAAYVGKVAANYPAQAVTPPAAAPASQQADAYSSLFGSTDPSTAPAAPTSQAPAQDAYTSLFGGTDPSSQGPTPIKAQTVTPSDQSFPYDKPGTYYGNLLPFSKDASGNVSLAVPEAIRSPLRGMLSMYKSSAAIAAGDRAETPDELGAASMLLGTGLKGIPGGANDFLPQDAAATAQAAIPDATADNQLASIPGQTIAQPENALAAVPAETVPAPAAAAPPPTSDGGTNALAGPLPDPSSVNQLAPVTVNPAAPAAPVAAPAVAVQPAVKAPKIGVGLFTNPDKVAAQVYDHYAAGGPTVVVPSQIPGVRLTAAQATANPNLARLESLMRDQDPNAFAALDANNTAARNAYAADIIGTPSDIDAAEASRNALTSDARDAAFANSIPVDPQPVIDALDQSIAAQRGNTAVVGALQDAKDSLMTAVDKTTNPNGTVTQTISPENLYNVRKDIGYSLSAKAKGTTADKSAAAAQLTPIMPVIDQTIEPGAPGFTAYMKQFSELSRPIDAQRALQAQGIVDAKGNVQLQKLNSLINNVEKQQSLPGPRAADSVTDDQLSRLKMLRDDFNMAGNSNLGKSAGSNTAQNLFVAGKTANLLAGHGGDVANLLAGGIGMQETGGALGMAAGLATAVARKVYLGRIAGAQEAAKNALVNRLVNPQ